MRRRFARVSLTAVCAAGTVSALDFPRNYPPPRALAFFLPWTANSPGVGTIEVSNAPGWGGQMPRTPSTLRHFSLISQSNSAVLSILMTCAILCFK